MTRYLTLLIALLIIGIFAIFQLTAPQLLTPPPSKEGEGAALIGGSFSLIDHHGKPFTDKDLLGKYALIYFGFTHCPDICPTTLLIVSNALNSLGPLADKITPVLITVDPERDTPELMANYVSNFHPSLIGLTGSTEQIQQAADAYKVYFAKVETKDSILPYVVDHSGYLFLMSPEGKYVTHFPHNVSDTMLVERLKKEIE